MYNFKETQNKWNKYWEDNKTFQVNLRDFSKPKYYVLDMFPYPSGEGLHVGHMTGYMSTDVIARFKRMQGFNVLHPVGFDSFGLPAEQYAIKTGNHPAEFTNKNIEHFIRQMKLAGISTDWDKIISTCEPSYYKWTQWIFKRLYEKGLANLNEMSVNWCEELGTVLANDEVIDGKSERGDFPVVKKKLQQWTLKITDYAQKLIDGLNGLDWPKSTATSQINWIDKSEGANVQFQVKDSDLSFTVFTTRPDTLFGATFCVLAPEHSLVKEITTDQQKVVVDEYVKTCATKTDIERTDTAKEKTGVWTGAYAINPINNKEVPIYIADYVLSTYASGALMAVPAHDTRDYDFAKKYSLEIIPVLEGGDINESAFVGEGKHINSDFINGLGNEESKKLVIEWLEKNNKGQRKTTYRLRDWVFARQRYWGEPLPVVRMEDGEIKLVDDNDLPVILPHLNNYKGENGQPPLNNAPEWYNVEINGKKGKRETTTMPGSAASSWYFLRYCDPKNDEKFADFDALKYWMPVDLYVGGAEHAVGHLLYSRFWNRFLYENGYSPVAEPFCKLRHVGMMLAEDGRKMSKRWKNVINPDDIINEYGCDAMRIYSLFMAPMGDKKAWTTNGIVGAKRFVDKVYNLYFESGYITDEDNANLEQVYNVTIKKVTEDFENLEFNTAISQMMIFVNAVQKEKAFPKYMAEGFIKLLNPITPYLAEEIWTSLFKHVGTIAYEGWPKYEAHKTIANIITMAVQVNGKMKVTIEVPLNEEDENIKKVVLDNEKIKNILGENPIKKWIIVKNRIVNIII